MRANRLISLLSQNTPVINGWLSIPSAWTAELTAHAGCDSLVVDMQHGVIGLETAIAMMQAISTTDVVPMVRVPWNDPALLMAVLDAGAYGVVCPMISTREQAEAFVGACRYPPLGYRSYGPTRSQIYGGEDYVAHANDTVLTFAMIETAQALDNLDAIASVPGLSGLYIGPSDLSISLGVARRADFDDPAMIAALDRVIAACTRYDLIPGVHAGSAENATRLATRGFRFLTPVMDAAAMQSAFREVIAQARILNIE
jgi:4-hydroxy-2-oxoheptanedioate aldolase